MSIGTHHPRISVKLFKTLGRKEGRAERYEGQRKEIDLTPLLGDRGNVSTQRSTAPTAGSFAISFADQPDPTVLDSLYGVIEPMDLIEIRMKRGPGEMPVHMRGFVQDVARKEGISDDGSPAAGIVVTGHDYGAVLHWWQFILMREFLNGDNPLLTAFQFQDALGLTSDVRVAGELIQEVVDKTANVWLSQLAFTEEKNRPKKLEIQSTVKSGRIGPWMVAGHHGDIWGFIQNFGDLAWNEAFVEDREDAPWFVYRPRPYKDAYTGNLILTDAEDPGTVEMAAVNVRGSNLRHGAARTATWYWVNAPAGSLIAPGLLSMDAILRGLPYDLTLGTGNSNPNLFGIRPMMAVSTQTANENATNPTGDLRVDREGWADKHKFWFQLRLEELVAMNLDNSAFEEGSLVLAGHEDLRPGKYLKLTRGGLVAEYYMAAVSHDFSPMRDWTATVHVERGTGFLERQKQGVAPIFLEGRPGVY